ncbi:MAG TPA: hypothetical protein VMU97_00090 [Candidatus Dormibacteraeota bacterium]|nr:hypothetical protein [Candidatus Dormibacteraeota bacterium]HVA11214.1 hypothetical protein [Candidatus Dormibacteraeota bacterium]
MARTRSALSGRPKAGRNGALYDKWSLVHLVTGVVLGWVMEPFVALLIMVLWEPLEIFVLSPLLARFDVVFGYESLNNSLSDIVFNCLGVALGAWVLAATAVPPFHLF